MRTWAHERPPDRAGGRRPRRARRPGDVVGGTTVELWISDDAVDPVRATVDVDVVLGSAGRGSFHEFGAQLRDAGFRNDVESGVICRWLHGPAETPLIVDVMPTDDLVFDFSNRWMPAAVGQPRPRVLPSGRTVQVISPEYLLASKLEAFAGRGRRDFYGSRDLEDVIVLVNGRAELVAEVGSASDDVGAFIAESIAGLLDDGSFHNALPGLLRPEERIDLVVLPRLRALAALAP